MHIPYSVVHSNQACFKNSDPVTAWLHTTLYGGSPNTHSMLPQGPAGSGCLTSQSSSKALLSQPSFCAWSRCAYVALGVTLHRDSSHPHPRLSLSQLLVLSSNTLEVFQGPSLQSQ